MYTYATSTLPVIHQHPQHHFTPKTPSPLRTSRNENLMPPPPPHQWSTTSPLDTKSSPLAPCYTSAQQQQQQQPFSPPTSPSHRSSTPPPSFSTTTTIRSDPHTWASTFASRSLSSTPQATLSAQNATVKDRRKSLFRNKIRKQRDDARFEGRGDQVLRMDFVRERREWEERLERRAPMGLDLDGGDGDAADSMEGVEEGSSGSGGEGGAGLPLTLTEEIDALAQGLMSAEDGDVQLRKVGNMEGSWGGRGQRQQFGDRQDSRFGGGGGSYGSDEEDYDQLFMEVISGSQDQDGRAQKPAQQQLWCERSGLDLDQDQPNSSMDLS